MKLTEATISSAMVAIRNIHFTVRNEIEEIKCAEYQQAFKIALEALDRELPKKTKITLRGTTGYSTKEFCPVCNAIAYGNYCYNCGQALDREYKKK